MGHLNSQIKIELRTKPTVPLKKRLRQLYITERLNNRVGYSVLAMIAIMISCTVVFAGPIIVFILLAVILGLPLVYAAVTFPKFGIITLLVSSYIIMLVDKFGNGFPTGTLMDGLIALLIIGFILKHKSDKSWDFAK